MSDKDPSIRGASEEPQDVIEAEEDFTQDEDEDEDVKPFFDDDSDNTDFPELDTLPEPTAESLDTATINNVVWSQKKQMALIVSIFRNFKLPPIILSRVLNSHGREILRCIDGKQRFTSVQLFFAGKIGFKHPQTGKMFYWKVVEGKKGRRVLPGKERQKFLRCRITVQRLQALSGPRSDWVKKLERKFLSEGKPLSPTVQLSRGRSFEAISHVAYCIQKIAASTRPVPVNRYIDGWLREDSSPSSQLKNDVGNTLITMSRLADAKLLSAGCTVFTTNGYIAPVEFTFIAILVHQMSKNHDDEEMADGIWYLRRSLKDSEKIPRTNVSNCKFLWGVLDHILNEDDWASATRQAREKWKAAQEPVVDPSSSTQANRVCGPVQASAKRERAEQSEGSSNKKAKWAFVPAVQPQTASPSSLPVQTARTTAKARDAQAVDDDQHNIQLVNSAAAAETHEQLFSVGSSSGARRRPMRGVVTAANDAENILQAHDLPLTRDGQMVTKAKNISPSTPSSRLQVQVVLSVAKRGRNASEQNTGRDSESGAGAKRWKHTATNEGSPSRAAPS
ncbi:hypothetical protein K488DRAFT_73805 [Vararia minispora EC-137]|uniref:Uncharacterized protein n=1 Tax=Vararia minispora EC-137 TaxID=1314806 RepID=A0ACB8QAU6_9AGAM|nr:hypothetical protein K488DRAFT_73805 [Vararia minispora EC-137]